MNDVLVLLKRDLRNSFNRRIFIFLFLLLFLQIWFVLTSDSIGQVKKTGEMFFMAAVFSFNFFGSIAALTLNFNGMSIERESKFLDLILTSGVSKKRVYLSKIITNVLFSGIFALSYVLVLTLFYLVMTGNIGISLLTLRYILPITAFLSLFGLMGLMFSVLFRSSKVSLITSIFIGILLMPNLFVSIVDGLNNLIGFNDKAVQVLYMISPVLAMNALNGYSEKTYVFWALAVLVIYLSAVIISGMIIFTKQDELNYGE